MAIFIRGSRIRTLLTMTKAFARILLIAYLGLFLRPFMPFAMDFMAHTFWYARHMATVHYENGKFHVHYEYLEALKQTAPEKNDHSPGTYTTLADHLVRIIEYSFKIPPQQKVFTERYSFSLPAHFPGRIDPPPRA